MSKQQWDVRGIININCCGGILVHATYVIYTAINLYTLRCQSHYASSITWSKIIFDINFTDFKNELFLYKDTKVSSFIYPCTNSPINKYAFHAAIFGEKPVMFL